MGVRLRYDSTGRRCNILGAWYGAILFQSLPCLGLQKSIETVPFRGVARNDGWRRCMMPNFASLRGPRGVNAMELGVRQKSQTP